MGAGVWQINLLLLKEFIIMLGLSVVIAAPLAFLLNDYWLNFMVVRDDISPGTVIFGAVILLVLGLLTIVPQTLRIAKSNPVKSLKTEG
jgi:putative ABC transport system permease protein